MVDNKETFSHIKEFQRAYWEIYPKGDAKYYYKKLKRELKFPQKLGFYHYKPHTRQRGWCTLSEIKVECAPEIVVSKGVLAHEVAHALQMNIHGLKDSDAKKVKLHSKEHDELMARVLRMLEEYENEDLRKYMKTYQRGNKK
jgi:hypothetical protein